MLILSYITMYINTFDLYTFSTFFPILNKNSLCCFSLFYINIVKPFNLISVEFVECTINQCQIRNV